MVEHRIMAFCQRCKVRKHSPGMDVSWCAAHDPVGLLHHGSHIQVVTVVEEILRGNKTEEMISGEEETVRFNDLFLEERRILASKSCF